MFSLILFSQLMTSLTLTFIFDQCFEQWLAADKEGKREIQKFEYIQNGKFSDEIKGNKFLWAIIWQKKKEESRHRL